MNESIIKQLTDPQKNKEQFVHEMTEVYLLLENELNHFVPSGTVRSDEFNIPDTVVQLKNSINSVNPMIPLSVPNGAPIDLSIKKINRNKIEASIPEPPVTKEFKSPTISLSLTDKPNISADVTDISVVDRIPDYNIGELNKNFTYVETNRFEYPPEYRTAVVPKKIIVEESIGIKDISGDIYGYSHNYVFSHVSYPAVQKGIKLEHNIHKTNIDIPNTLTLDNVNVSLSIDKETSMPLPVTIDHTPVDIVNNPNITKFFTSGNEMAKSSHNEHISIPAVSAKIPPKYHPEPSVQVSALSEWQNNAIDLPEVKIDVQLLKTIEKENIPAPIQVPRSTLWKNNLKEIPIKRPAMLPVKLNMSDTAVMMNFDADPCSSETAVRKQKPYIDGKKLKSVKIQNDIRVEDIAVSGIGLETITPEPVHLKNETAAHPIMIGSISVVPSVEYKEFKHIPTPVTQTPNIASRTVTIPDKNVSVAPFTEKYTFHADRLNIPAPKVDIKPKQTAHQEIRINRMVNMTNYIAKSYDTIQKILSNKTASTEKSAINAAVSQPDIDVSLPNIADYSQDILNSLQKHIHGA